MGNLGTSKEIFLEQFLKWWGIYFALIIGFFVLNTLLNGRMPNGDVSLVIIAATVCTALGSLMAISHYYLIYNKYWHKRRYGIYLLLSICLIGSFILLDAMVFYLVMGSERFLHDGIFHIIFVSIERVMYM